MKRPKTPHRKENPSTQKKARRLKDFSSDSELLTWHVGTIDAEGPWGWKNLSCEVVWNQIHSKIANFETMTWVAIKQSGGSHVIPISDICTDAKRRLNEIKMDDIDELFSLRLTGKQRIWGIRDRHILKVLWWDPEHEVCPSYKSYT